MATIPAVFKSGPGPGESTVVWDGMVTGDVGAPVRAAKVGDKSVTVSGTIGTSTLALEGTNEEDTPDVPDLTTMQVLHNPTVTTAISYTTLPKQDQILEVTKWIRPNLSGGAGASGVKVTVLFRRQTSHV